MFQWKNYNPPCGLSDSGPVHCLWAIFHVFVNYILLPLAFVSNYFVKINVSNFSPTLLTWYHWELKTDCPHWDSRLCSSYCFHKALEAEAGKLDINLKGVITTGSITQGVLQSTRVFHSLLLKITVPVMLSSMPSATTQTASWNPPVCQFCPQSITERHFEPYIWNPLNYLNSRLRN